MAQVAQSYWDESYAEHKYCVQEDDLTKWLSFHLSDMKGTVFEVGCYPGRYLAFFGKRGWTVSGMDLTPRMETYFKDWLSATNISYQRIEKGDALDYMKNSSDQYDLVCSFGFIEHFKNYSEVIALHDNILKSGGHLNHNNP